MKKYFFFLLFCSSASMAQKLQPMSTYLASKQVSKAAKDFYKKLPVYQKDPDKYYNDNNVETLVRSIADSLNTTNKNTRAFYIYLVNRNGAMADGALLEMQSEAQFHLLLDAPATFFQYMLDNPAEKTKYLAQWQKNAGLWLMQPGNCSLEYSVNEEACKKEYQDKVMAQLETASAAVKALAVSFFAAPKQ